MKNYHAQMYGKRSPDFIKGYLAALADYGAWIDGKQVVGCLSEELDLVRKQVIDAMAENPEHWKEGSHGDGS